MTLARMEEGPARRHLPDRVALAESLARMSGVEMQVQDGRHEWLRDYRHAGSLLAAATVVADSADASGRRIEGDLAAMAGHSVDSLEPVLKDAVRAANLVRLTADGRRHLERARVAFEEARIHLSAGRYQDAIDQAGLADELARGARTAAAAHVRRYGDPSQRKAWRRAVSETIEWSRSVPGRLAVVVNKETRTLTVYSGGKVHLVMDVELGKAGFHDKRKAGDHATPEGRYRVIHKKDVGQAKYYKALALDYPNAEDRARFQADRRAGRISRRSNIGGDIQIHGHGGKGRDWTQGCVAVRNDQMDILLDLIPEGTPVTIVASDGGSGPVTDLVNGTGMSGNGGKR
jgi:L,D-peptidoglycan transpeptidase YkuD (ErfK/YbiS/YcfS/YnhG family)